MSFSKNGSQNSQDKCPITVITGASSGLGESLAKLAISEGHTVVINARRRDRLEKLAQDHEKQVLIVDGDLQESVVRERIVRACEPLGCIDYLFNNAGFGNFGSFEKESDSTTANMIGLNVVALMEMTRLSLPLLKKSHRGRILNIASVFGQVDMPYVTTYCTTKHAVVAFSRCLQGELSSTNVTVSAVCPGGFDSEIYDGILSKERIASLKRVLVPLEKMAAGVWNKKDTRCNIIYPLISNAFMAHSYRFLSILARPLTRIVMTNLYSRMLKREN